MAYYGNIIKQNFISKEIVWHIPNFFSLPEQIDYFVDCPSFSFANSKWCLRLFPNGQNVTESRPNTQGFVDLKLVRLSSEHSDDVNYVKFKFGYVTRRRKEYKINPVFHTFESRDRELCIDKMRKWSDLLSKQYKVLHSGMLIMCFELSIMREVPSEQEASYSEKSIQVDLPNAGECL